MTSSLIATFVILLIALVASTRTSPTNDTTSENSLKDPVFKDVMDANSGTTGAEDVTHDHRELGDDATFPLTPETTDEESDHNSIQHGPCEAGFPCEDDFWCAQAAQRCRHCSELDPWCNKTTLIHDSYAECEHYCYRQETEKTRACEKEKTDGETKISHLEANLKDIDIAMQELSEQASEDIHRCTAETEGAQNRFQDQVSRNQDLTKQIASLNEEVKRNQNSARLYQDREQHCEIAKEEAKEMAEAANQRAREEEERADELKQQVVGFRIGLGVALALWLGTLSLWIFRSCRSYTRRGQTSKSLLRQNADQSKSRKPVPAERHSTHFSDHNHPTDQYCLAGGGGYAHLKNETTVAV